MTKKNTTIHAADLITQTTPRGKMAAAELSIRPDSTVSEASRIPLEEYASQVHPDYRQAFKNALDSHKKATVYIRPSAKLLLDFYAANQRNRTPEMSHYALLGMIFRTGFQPELSDFAVTTDRQVANGGHSVRGCIGAAMPPDVIWLAQLNPVQELVYDEADCVQYDAKGKPVTETRYDELRFPRSASIEYDDEGNEKPASPGQWISVTRTTGLDEVETDEGPAPEYETWTMEEVYADAQTYVESWLAGLPEDNRWLRLTINVAPQAVTTYDTISRGRQGAEQLELFHPSRAFVERNSSWLNFKLLEQVLKSAFLRSKEPTTDENGDQHFGTPKGGGNTARSLFPVFYLTFIERIHGNWIACREVNKSKVCPDGDFTRSKHLADVGLKDLLVAYAVCSKPAAVRLAKLVSGKGAEETIENETLQTLIKMFAASKSKAVTAPAKPDASTIQSFLIAAANGIQLDTSKNRKDYVQQLAARGIGWDRGDLQEGESVREVLHESSLAVDAYFGEDNVRSAGFKPRTRKEYAPRKKQS